ncbi:hypothetical protein C8T65DRAFT_565852 [Cerioporus squamosus]|nr:hypothetical protein C8T65DRAFT_565852 [Cerioporus squamosus]
MDEPPSAERAASPLYKTDSVSPSIRTSSPVPTPAPAPAPNVAAVSVSPQRPASTVPVSSPARTTPVVPSLPPKPDVEPERRPIQLRRRSRSPPTGPRHHVPTPSNRSPAQGPYGGPNLPPRPDWNRRSNAHGGVRPVEAPAPAAAPEPAGFQPVIPPYQPKTHNTTAGIEAEIARLRSHRMHVEHEYVAIAKETRKAMYDLFVADCELQLARERRKFTGPLLEKAKEGTAGIDFIHEA